MCVCWEEAPQTVNMRQAIEAGLAHWNQQPADARIAVVVGPPMMIKFSIKTLLGLGFDEEKVWVSESRKMCCGVGKCGHCRIGEIYVCQDGPVFKYTQVRSFID